MLRKNNNAELLPKYIINEERDISDSWSKQEPVIIMSRSGKISKIYVHAIDGTDCWIHVPVTNTSSNQFTILPHDEYDPEDTGCVMQFIPGDTVTVRKKQFTNGSEELVADSLIRSEHPDKDYWELLYQGANNNLNPNKFNRDKYWQASGRVKKELERGTFTIKRQFCL